jgi:predicted CXXCH cytochrome family protein
MYTVSVSGSENPYPERKNSGLKGKMGEHRPVKWVITTVILTVLLFSASGCTKQTRYKVLTFFFTGVPPLEEQIEVQGEEGKKTGENRKKAAEVSKQKIFSHTPYAAGQCNQCHATRQLFGTVSQRVIPRIKKSGARETGMLVVPLKELCVACHKYLSASNTSQQGFWLHGPAATGRCTACHSPHQSKYRHMLSGEADEVCKRCHAEGFILNTADHKKSTECFSCHNPHLGKDRNLLKKVYQEVSQPVGPLPGAPGPQASSGNLQKGGAAARNVSETGESKSPSTVKDTRVIPNLSEVLKTQKKSSGKAKERDEVEGVEVEAKPPSTVTPSRVIPSLQEVLNLQEKSAGKVKGQGEGGGVEVEAKSPSTVTPSRVIPSPQEVLNLQEKSAGKVKEQGEGGGVEVEAKSPSSVTPSRVIPSLQEVLNLQEKSAGEEKGQDEVEGAEVEAKSPSSVTPGSVIPSLQEVLNLQEKSAAEVSDRDDSEDVQDREPKKMGEENYSGTDGGESRDPSQHSVVSRLDPL